MIRESIQQLLSVLNRWDRRLRLQQSVLWTPRSLIIGLGLGVALAAATRLRPLLLPGQVLAISAGVVLAGVVIMLAVIWLRQTDALRAARRFDDLFDLKERVSTALELAAGGIRSPNEEITTRLVEDSLTRAAGVNAAAYLPLRVRGREVLVALALAAALGLLIGLPNPQNTALAEQQAFNATLEEQVEALEGLRAQVAAEEGLDEAVQREMLDALDEAVEQLSREALSQEETFATLSDLAGQMQALVSGEEAAIAQERAMQEALQQAMQQMSRSLETEGDPDSEAAPPEGMQSPSQTLQALAEGVGAMSEVEQQALAEALQAAAGQLAGTTPELSEALQEASEALERGDTAAAQETLEEAARQAQENSGEQGAAAQRSRTRQMASQAAQQAQRSAQQMAQAGRQQAGEAGPPEESGQQAGQQPGQQSGQQSGDQPGAGNTATRIEQGSAGQEGQPAQLDGQGQAGAEGQPAGQETQGQSAGESDAGTSGAGDGESGPQEGGQPASGEQISQENSPSGDGLTDYEPVFAPQSIGPGAGQQMPVSGAGEPGDSVTQEGEFMENPEGDSIVGYDEVFSNYANAANQALERDYIPLALRDVIHDYFAALEP